MRILLIATNRYNRWMSKEEVRPLPIGLAYVAAYIDRAAALLGAVCADYELILIDDGSTDRTWEIVADCQRTRPWLQ